MRDSLTCSFAQLIIKGDEAKEVLHRRARASDSLGFHLQEEGVVTDVEMYQTAWRCGLRQGSRIVEVKIILIKIESNC